MIERRYDGLFRPGTDYKKTFKEEVDKLLAEQIDAQTRRTYAANKLIEAYTIQTGTRPDGYQLYRLANFLMTDVLKDKNPDKVSRTEFPVLSQWQIKTRNNRERKPGDDHLDTLNLKQKKRVRTLGNKKTLKQDWNHIS